MRQGVSEVGDVRSDMGMNAGGLSREIGNEIRNGGLGVGMPHIRFASQLRSDLGVDVGRQSRDVCRRSVSWIVFKSPTSSINVKRINISITAEPYIALTDPGGWQPRVGRRNPDLNTSITIRLPSIRPLTHARAPSSSAVLRSVLGRYGA